MNCNCRKVKECVEIKIITVCGSLKFKNEMIELVNKNLISIRENEEISYCIFENQECDNINLYEIEFEHCKFNNICMQKGGLEKITFRDVLFEIRRHV